MAITRSRRLHRYNRLRSAGFTGGEALRFSRVYLDAPYLKRMIKERQALTKDLDEKEKEQAIRDLYIRKGWIHRGTADYWALLRDAIERAKDRGEEYESPAMLKVKKRRGERKVNREWVRRGKQKAKEKEEQQKYPYGRHYRRGM